MLICVRGGSFAICFKNMRHRANTHFSVGDGRQAFISPGFSLPYRLTTFDHFLNFVILEDLISDVPKSLADFAASPWAGHAATAKKTAQAAIDLRVLCSQEVRLICTVRALSLSLINCYYLLDTVLYKTIYLGTVKSVTESR